MSTTGKILAVIVLPIVLQGCGVIPIPFPGLEHYAWQLQITSQNKEGTIFAWGSDLYYDTKEECETVAEEIKKDAARIFFEQEELYKKGLLATRQGQNGHAEIEYSSEDCTITATDCEFNIVGKSALYTESQHPTPLLCRK